LEQDIRLEQDIVDWKTALQTAIMGLSSGDAHQIW